MNAATKKAVAESETFYAENRADLPDEMSATKFVYLAFWETYIFGPGFEKQAHCGEFAPDYHHWADSKLNTDNPCVCGAIHI